MRVADFFCGGGGFSEGFRQAGFEIVFAVDKWAPAVNTYKGNKPGANVIQDDVIRISNLPDDEFEALVPDSEVIIGSPPCQSFSHSNKSGNADKELGIKLIEAYPAVGKSICVQDENGGAAPPRANFGPTWSEVDSRRNCKGRQCLSSQTLYPPYQPDPRNPPDGGRRKDCPDSGGGAVLSAAVRAGSALLRDGLR